MSMETPSLFYVLGTLLTVTLASILSIVPITSFLPAVAHIWYQLKSELGPRQIELSSSAWCFPTGSVRTRCHFHNLCYRPESGEFIFFDGPWSTSMGIPQNRQRVVSLTSADELNTYTIDLVVLPSSASRNFTIQRLHSPSILMSRFKPDNLMHVFHDDLLPIFATLQELCEGEISWCTDFQFIFVDRNPALQYYDLYRLFTKHEILFAFNMANENLYCFENALVGLNVATLWYQYGYGKPQGPIKEHTSSGKFLREFTDYIIQRYFFRDCPAEEFIILLTRAHNRRVLNEEELSLHLASKTGYSVRVITLDDDRITDAIRFIRCSHGIVSVHGAQLILAMFLPAGAFVLEIFPYAVPPEDYTAYRAMCSLPGMDIPYLAWVNKNASMSVTHPDWPSQLGGIMHLPEDMQREIKSQKRVPKQECCDNPAWLYRAYQDTVVNVTEIAELLDEVEKPFSESAEPFVPSKVQHLSCVPADDGSGFNLAWDPPWSLLYQSGSTHTEEYEIWLQAAASESVLVTRTTQRWYHALTHLTELNVWVSAVGNGVLGAPLWVRCLAS